jgi:peptidyl-prolyl cis-trans isomerase SurA
MKLMTLPARLLLLVVSCVLPMIAYALPARAETAAVTGDVGPITDDDIEQRTRLDFLSTHKQAARQDVIDELTADRMNIKEAAKHGINPTSDDVDGIYAEMCARMRTTPEQLGKALEGNGVGIETLKRRIKADIARASLARLQRR